MRKYLYLVMVAVFASLSWGLTACSSDDDSDDLEGGAKSEIVGKWDVEVVTTKYYTTVPEAQDYYNREDVEYGSGEYWEFTSSKIIIHDENDLMNGKAVKYSYKKDQGELTISVGLKYQVKKLTATTMILVLDTSDGQFGVKTTIEFSKQ